MTRHSKCYVIERLILSTIRGASGEHQKGQRKLPLETVNHSGPDIVP
jgi:hypothetical protein